MLERDGRNGALSAWQIFCFPFLTGFFGSYDADARCVLRTPLPYMILFVTFVILFLILVNAFYVAAEFAAVSVRRNMIREMAENGSRVAVHLLKILENTKELDRYIAACQFGITISSLVLGAYGQVELAAYLFPLFERFGGMDSVMANSAAALVVLIGLTVFR